MSSVRCSSRHARQSQQLGVAIGPVSFDDLTVYTLINLRLGGRARDPYPFILLNLILSMVAAIQAPLIMMSQNRQDKIYRLRGELDFAVNRRAASDIQGLAAKLNLLVDKVGDLDDELRARKL